MIPEAARPGMEEGRGEMNTFGGGSISIEIHDFTKFHEIC